MNTNTNLLILERSSSELEFKNEGGVYVLEGIFGEIDKKNRNNRIYTESEYVPQIEALQAKIASTKLLGELDHPQTFDVSLKNVSHVIEELTYDKETKQVKGKIRLLDTEAGRQAKALVDAGVPLQISSRAAGTVESNGTVKIKQLFTYDLVADPGFENAELKRVNESYGFGDADNIQIYEMGIQTELLTTENKTETEMAESKFISTEDFNKYSQYLATEIKSLKEGISSLGSDESTKSEIESIKEYSNYLAKKVEDSIEYTGYLAENLDTTITSTTEMTEKLDNSISYSEHIAEGVDQIKNYTNYLAESYNDGAETHENVMKYVSYLKENLEKVTEYAEYVAETVNSNLLLEDGAGKEVEEIEKEDDSKDVTEPTVDADGKKLDHGAEVTDDSAELEAELEDSVDGAGDEEISEEEVAGIEAEDLEDETTEVANDVEAPEDKSTELEAELEDTVDAAGDEEIAEASVVMDATDPKSKTLAKLLKKHKVTMEVIDQDGPSGFPEVELTGARKDLEAVLASEDGWDDAGLNDYIEESNDTFNVKVKSLEEVEETIAEETTVDSLDAYKNEISSKLSALIEKATVKTNSNPHFFRFISESNQEQYNTLNTEDQSKVSKAIEGKGFLTEGQILTLWNSALIVNAPTNEPNVIAMMPTEYKETYSKLSEAKKSSLIAQSKYHRLETEYQVRNFWQTRDLRDSAVVMEKVELVNEAVETVETKKPLYDLTDMKQQLNKRFNK